MAKKPPKVDESAQSGGDKVIEQHRRIRVLVNRLDKTTDLRLIVPQLQELRILLDEHFEQEEAPDGFPEMIAQPAPHHARALDELFDEHKVILSNLDDVIEKALFCLEGPLATVRRSVTSLCEQLRTHEATETVLLTDTVYTDLGIGD
jgi:hypothetical protein